MDGKASARVTQVEQVWVQKKIATNIAIFQIVKEQNHIFPALSTLHSSQPSQRGESWDPETNLVSSLNLKEIGHWQTHFFFLETPMLYQNLGTPGASCSTTWLLAPCPPSLIWGGWQMENHFLNLLKSPFWEGWIFAIFLICFVFTSLREVFETPGSRVVGDLLVTKLIFLTRCIYCKVMSAKKSLKQLEWQQQITDNIW